MNLYLYYYNANKEAAELYKISKVVNGYVTIQIEHCSTYVLTTKQVRKNEQFPAVSVNKSDDKKKAPVRPDAKTAAKTAKTGDDTPVEGLILLAGLSAVAMVFMWRSRRRHI